MQFLDLNIPQTAEILKKDNFYDELSQKGIEGIAVVYAAGSGATGGGHGGRHDIAPCPKSHANVVGNALKHQVKVLSAGSSTTAFNPNLHGFKVYSRVHILLESSANVPSKGNQAINSYNLVSVEPANEKMFALACQELEFVDLITIDMSQKIPFYFKASNVNMAISRGVRFELSYSAALRDATARKYFISNAYSLVKATKGKNIIISSGAINLLELRGVFDVINMCSLFDLSTNAARDSMTKECHNAIMHAATRTDTVRGVVGVERIPPDLEEREKWKIRRLE